MAHTIVRLKPGTKQLKFYKCFTDASGSVVMTGKAITLNREMASLADAVLYAHKSSKLFPKDNTNEMHDHCNKWKMVCDKDGFIEEIALVP